MSTHQGGQDIRDRVFAFAIQIVRLCQQLDEKPGVGRSISRQLIRSGTAIGANLEEAKAGHSRADFVAKCEISLKEAHETYYWLRLLSETSLQSGLGIEPLTKESDEITRIIGAIVVSADKGRRRS